MFTKTETTVPKENINLEIRAIKVMENIFTNSSQQLRILRTSTVAIPTLHDVSIFECFH